MCAIDFSAHVFGPQSSIQIKHILWSLDLKATALSVKQNSHETFQFSRNTQSWQSRDFILLKFRNKLDDKSILSNINSKHYDKCKIVLKLNGFQFLSIRICTKDSNVANFVYFTGKLDLMTLNIFLVMDN